jgi:hypothetical protein
MSDNIDFIAALQDKITLLEEEKYRIMGKIALLEELMSEECGLPSDTLAVRKAGLTSVEKSPSKKRGGRPKGSKNKKSSKSKGSSKHAVADELYDEAMIQLEKSGEGGTSKEMQEKLTKRFNPIPRPPRELGAGITAGTRKEVEEAQARRTPNARVSIEEGE